MHIRSELVYVLRHRRPSRGKVGHILIRIMCSTTEPRTASEWKKEKKKNKENPPPRTFLNKKKIKALKERQMQLLKPSHKRKRKENGRRTHHDGKVKNSFGSREGNWPLHSLFCTGAFSPTCMQMIHSPAASCDTQATYIPRDRHKQQLKRQKKKGVPPPY